MDTIIANTGKIDANGYVDNLLLTVRWQHYK